MENIIDREVAWRIFAYEFNRSNLYISEGDERAPNYIITPTGAKCNRLFVVGVVTEIENIGEDNNLWRARIADPTGVFTVYAGQYQPEAAIFLSELSVPAYVAVVGKARKYEPEDGSVYTSIRPEEINYADERLRDRWVLDTAERTLERIRVIEDALSSGLSGNELKEYLIKKGTNAVLADGAVRAVGHYKNLDKLISELKNVLIHAVEMVSSESVKTNTSETHVDKLEKPQVNTGEDAGEHGFGEGYIQEQNIQEQNAEKMKKPQMNADERKSKKRRVEKSEQKSEQKAEELKKIIIEPESSPDAEADTEASAQIEPKEVLAAIIDKLDTGKGTTYSMVVEAAISAGMDAESTDACIKELMAEGRCYEPKIGVLRKV